jgi:subtilisin-like proprotein convertase family protein
VDVTHTYIGDLVVTLTSPGGTSVTLHDHAGDDADNLITTYTTTTTPKLADLRGSPLQGPWTLRVADDVRLDVGKLNRWAVRIMRES